MRGQGKIVYTIGHSNRSLDEFLNLLKHYGISIIVDVRRFPKSTKYPYFSKDNLVNSLSREGIKYIWLGDKLGGFRNGGYVNYMKHREFKEGLQLLIKIIESNPNVGIMCCEKFWFKCHRKFIANELAKKGYIVIHIIDKDKVGVHKIKDYH